MGSNAGGAGVSVGQNASNLSPVYKDNQAENLNGYPMIYFDGVNDYFKLDNNSFLNITSGPWDERSFFLVFKTSGDVSSRQVLYEEGGNIRGFNFYIYNNKLYYGAWNLHNDGPGSSWGYYSYSTPINQNEAYILSFRFKGNATGTGIISCGLNGEHVGTIQNVGLIYNHSGAIGIGSKKGSTHYENAGSNGNGQYFEGYMAEFIVFTDFINESSTKIVDNYLSAKYDIALTDNDLYQMDNNQVGDFDHAVAGLCKVSNSDFIDDAQGCCRVRINNPTDLDNGEHFIWGHNNLAFEGLESFDVPATVQARLDRVWRVDEEGEVGGVDLLFDLSLLGLVNPSDLRLVVDMNNDGFFIDETIIGGGVVFGATDEGNGIYKFSNVNIINDGMNFTLATINKFQTPLPIKLVEFKATPNINYVSLNWTTKSELNNDYFTLERSVDGVFWESVATIKGAGNSTKLINYYHQDNSPLIGISYYRLSQTDYDGTESHSEMVSVKIENNNQDYSIYPNPASVQINIQLPNDVDELKIFNAQGRMLISHKDVLQGNSIIDVSNYEKGIYFIQFIKNNSAITKKFIVK